MIDALLALTLQGWSLPAARPCTDAEIAALTAPQTDDYAPYRLACRAVLGPGQAVTRRVLFEGSAASGAGLDCAGGAVGAPDRRTTSAAPTIAIWSERIHGAEGPLWRRPTDIAITNCTVYGSIRIWGMGAGGGYDDLRLSSQRADHTALTQAAAPSHIRLEGVRFVATGSIPLYLGPGVTFVTVDRARFTGMSDATAVYLDAESAHNAVTMSEFDIATGREQIALDGSAHNRVAANRFNLRGRGGVFLYRNCGERGVVRHQTPSFNTITDNRFRGAARFRANMVVAGSREGRRSYCGDDAGFAFGSSLDDGDQATGNLIARNRREP